MSSRTAVDDPLRGLRRVRTGLGRLWMALAGDRAGEAIFVGSVLCYAVVWQTGIVIVDTYAVANGLVALSRGHLAIETATYGPGLATPGMHYVDGAHYARNYGQVVAALPVYLLLEAADAAAELRVVVAALWSLCLVWFARTVAALRGDRRLLTGGAAAALLVFGLNLRSPTPVPDGQVPVMALQLVSMLGAALCGVFAYRLLSRAGSRRVAVTGGLLVALGTPVAFWATIPKRHTLTTALILGVGYLLYRSRTADRAAPWQPTTLRAGTYGLVGLLAWVHAPIALTLFLPLVATDLPTAASNDRRDLAVVAAGLGPSLVPFLVTNFLISGNPFAPPRLLPAAAGQAQSTSGAGATGGGGATGSGAGDGGGSTAVQAAADAVSDAVSPFLSPAVGWATDVASSLGFAVGTYWSGARTLLADPGRLYHVVLVSSADIGGVPSGSVEQASNLAMLEAAPVVAAALALPVAWGVSRIRRDDGSASLRAPEPTDLLFLSFSLLLVLVYLPRLPNYGQLTVRYLTPLYPIAVYAVCKYEPFARRLEARWRACAYGYEGTVLVGTQLFLVGVVWFELGEPGAFDWFSTVALVVGAVLFLAAAFADRFDRGFASLVGVAGGTGSMFVTLALLVFFHYGVHLLPVVQTVTETVRRLLVRLTV